MIVVHGFSNFDVHVRLRFISKARIHVQFKIGLMKLEYKRFSISCIYLFVSVQEAAFASRYMSLSSVVEVSALESVDMIALGHFLCGLSADDLASISPDVYG